MSGRVFVSPMHPQNAQIDEMFNRASQDDTYAFLIEVCSAHIHGTNPNELIPMNMLENQTFGVTEEGIGNRQPGVEVLGRAAPL